MSNQNYLDEEDEEELMPFEGIEKSAVLQQCRDFSSLNIDVHNCMGHMTNVLYLIGTGTTLTPNEATEIFFGSTKLFQNDNVKLRRLLYVFMKELSGVAEQVFIASSSLVKDITSNREMFKANAIRTLRKVTDATMISSMERILIEAVIDKNSNVVNSALVTGIHLARIQPDIVKRWATEVAEALANRGSKTQYHALALLHKIRKNDRLSVLRLVGQVQNSSIRSPLAICSLIKMCTELMQEDFAQSTQLYNFVISMTHHSSELVCLEAAKSICSLRNIFAKEVSPAVMLVGLYLTASKPVSRYAAIRLLNKVATLHPTAVASLNADIEALVSDPNRSIATLAVTTLLKTGTEFSIDRLVKQLSGSLGDLSDEFKIMIVESMRVLNLKFPSKHATLLDFLYSVLRSPESGGELKAETTNTMIAIANANALAKDSVLTRLADYIQDCEFPAIIQRVLTLIGDEGPKSSNPKRFIRFIYNHVMLEEPMVRAAAVSTLATFAAYSPALRPSIAVLFKRTMHDPDDEVRDRAVFYYKLFTQGDEVAIKTLVSDVSASVSHQRQKRQKAIAATRVHEDEIVIATATAQAAATNNAAAAASSSTSAGGAVYEMSTVVLQARDRLRRIAQLKELGEPLRSHEPVPLTEPDNEYVVSVVKHLYTSSIVFQFQVTNTMDGINLQSVNVDVDLSELTVEPRYAIPIQSVAPGTTECAYVVVDYEAYAYPSGTIPASFRFSMEEDGEVGDEASYPMEEFQLNVSDFILPFAFPSAESFESQWTAFKGEASQDTYQLPSIKTIGSAVSQLVDFYGMSIVGEKPDKITTKSHVVNMSGTLADDQKTLILISGKVFVAVGAANANTVALTLELRGGSEDVRKFLSAALVS